VKRDAVYRFTVSDDGQGFDAGAVPDAAGAHIGLRIMRERAQRIGGRLEVQSQPGAGTTVILTVPAVQDAAHAGQHGREVHA
jgi:two-component system nitrate/nitrite sensor histidine kinase NarX